MVLRLAAIAPFVVVAALVTAEGAMGCSCAYVKPEVKLRQSDGAVVARLVAVRPLGTEADFVFRSGVVLKGAPELRRGRRVVVRSASSDAICGLTRGVGRLTGLFLSRSDGRWHGGTCGEIPAGQMRRLASRRGPGDWRRAPQAPLSARESAVTVWTGREALVMGGSDARPCPPNASCAAPRRPPLRSGAAYDPDRRSWRRIADAPVGFAFATAARVRGTVYVATPGDSRPAAPAAVLAYDIALDRWRRLPTPQRPRRNYVLVAAGGRLIAHGRGARRGPPGYVLGPRGRTWRALPDGPLPEPVPLAFAWSGRELVMFGSARVGIRAERPPLARAAAFDFDTGTWRRLPHSSTVMFGHEWVRVGARLINPALNNGSSRYRWGRPLGGILNARTGAWSDLPDPPAAGPFHFGAGLLTRQRAHFGGPDGDWLLDVPSARWLRVPALGSRRVQVQGRARGCAGRRLLVFGGARFARSSPGGRLTNDTWTWSPPR